MQGKEGERDFWSNIMPEAIAAHDQQVHSVILIIMEVVLQLVPSTVPHGLLTKAVE